MWSGSYVCVSACREYQNPEAFLGQHAVRRLLALKHCSLSESPRPFWRSIGNKLRPALEKHAEKGT